MIRGIPNVLTIAGCDPSGGAGILADVKAFSALGAYGTAVLTALTAQNTLGVTGVQPVAPAFVKAQLETLLADVRIDALKIGMVASADIIRAIVAGLGRCSAPLVVDPVMVAKSGDRLLDESAVDALRSLLVPAATLLTPNLPEAGVLLGRPAPASVEDMRHAALALHALGARQVLVKGGHLAGSDSPDVYYDGQRLVELNAPRVLTRNTHGTGCTLSAAIAALLPRSGAFQRGGLASGAVESGAVESAVRGAKAYVASALQASDRLAVGSGHGPLHHFHDWWPPSST